MGKKKGKKKWGTLANMASECGASPETCLEDDEAAGSHQVSEPPSQQSQPVPTSEEELREATDRRVRVASPAAGADPDGNNNTKEASPCNKKTEEFDPVVEVAEKGDVLEQECKSWSTPKKKKKRIVQEQPWRKEDAVVVDPAKEDLQRASKELGNRLWQEFLDENQPEPVSTVKSCQKNENNEAFYYITKTPVILHHDGKQGLKDEKLREFAELCSSMTYSKLNPFQDINVTLAKQISGKTFRNCSHSRLTGVPKGKVSCKDDSKPPLSCSDLGKGKGDGPVQNQTGKEKQTESSKALDIRGESSVESPDLTEDSITNFQAVSARNGEAFSWSEDWAKTTAATVEETNAWVKMMSRDIMRSLLTSSMRASCVEATETTQAAVPSADEEEKEESVNNPEVKQEEEEKQAVKVKKTHMDILVERLSSSSKEQAPYLDISHLIYDKTGSYMGLKTMLPQVTNRRPTAMAVLSMRLQTNGRLLDTNKEAEHQVLEPESSLPILYPFLLHWFLSHVSLTPNRAYQSQQSVVPFIVLGLQQGYWNGELRLFVAVARNPSFTPTPKHRIRTRKHGEDSFIAFTRQLQQYLACNTVADVCRMLRLYCETHVTYWRNGYVDYAVLLGDANKCDMGYPLRLSISEFAKPLSSMVDVSDDRQAVKKIFSLQPDFFWKRLETKDPLPFPGCGNYCPVPDVTLQRLPYRHFNSPMAMTDLIFNFVYQGADVAGIRLVHKSDVNTLHVSDQPESISDEPVLAITLRSHRAYEMTLENPYDPGEDLKEAPQLHCLIKRLTNGSRIDPNLPEYFGGQFTSSILTEALSFLPTLTYVTPSTIILVITPLALMWLFPRLLFHLQRMGWGLVAVCRFKVTKKHKNLFRLDNMMIAKDERVFGFLLCKENATVHVPALRQCVTRLLLHGTQVKVLKGYKTECKVDALTAGISYTTAMEEDVNKIFYKVPEMPYPDWSLPWPEKFYLEGQTHVVGIFFTTPFTLQIMGALFYDLQRYHMSNLLAFKVLPTITTSQATVVSPYEVGASEFPASLRWLAGRRVVGVALLIGPSLHSSVLELASAVPVVTTGLVDEDVEGVLKGSRRVDLAVTMTLECAMQAAAMFFEVEELFKAPPDHRMDLLETLRHWMQKVQEFDHKHDSGPSHT